MAFITAYGPKIREEKIVCDASKGLTKQSHKDECDINKIVRRYKRDGVLSHINSNPSFYGDGSSDELMDAIEKVRQAEEMFANLPSKIRNRFRNNPVEYVAFVSQLGNDKAAVKEAVELGILARPKPGKEPELPSALSKPAVNTEVKP